MKRTIIPGTIPTKDLHQYIIGSIGPRPIAFVSTVDEDGKTNLAPYSFFNAFSSNPPILVFSSNRKVSDNTTKDTLKNVRLTGEAVINVVSYPIVRQMALASVEFPYGVSEFEKVGLTAEQSQMVKPPRVKESPVSMECKVQEIITLGDQGGAGHLIICNVLLMHINEAVLDGNRIVPDKIDLVGRLGRAYYVRASGESVFTLYQPVNVQPLGFDGLPKFITHHKMLSGNEIAKIAALESMPNSTDIELYKNNTVTSGWNHSDHISTVKKYLADGDPAKALLHLLAFQDMIK